MSEITINYAADTSQFEQGVTKLTGGFELIEKALDAISATGESVSKEFVLNFLQSERAAKQSAEEIERVLTESYNVPAEAAKEMARITKSGLEDVQDEADKTADATGKVGDGLKDVGSIAKDALEGDLAGAAKGGIDAISGLAAVVPGAGVLIGTVFAEVGKGLVDMWNQRAEESEKRVKSMYDNFIESSLTYLTEAQKIAAISEIAGDPEALAKLRDEASILGLTVETLIEAQIEKGEARNAVQNRLNELLDEANQKLDDGSITTADNLVALEGYAAKYDELNSEQQKAVDGAEIYRSTVQQITGEQQLSNEELQKQNKILAETPKSLPVTLEVDRSQIDAALQRRTLRIDVEGYTREGARVV